MSESILTYHVVGNQEDTRARILAATISLLSESSYRDVSLDKIAGICGIKKQSLFHYFPSKQAMVLAALERFNGYYQDELFALAHEETPEIKQQLNSFLEKAEQLVCHQKEAGFISCLAIDFRNLGSELQQEVCAHFEAWEVALKKLLAPLLGEHKAEEQKTQ